MTTTTEATNARRNRKTGTRVTLIDNRHCAFDPDMRGTPWVTVCEEHEQVGRHHDKREASHACVNPDSFCSDCAEIVREQYDGPRTNNTETKTAWLGSSNYVEWEVTKHPDRFVPKPDTYELRSIAGVPFRSALVVSPTDQGWHVENEGTGEGHDFDIGSEAFMFVVRTELEHTKRSALENR